MHTHDEEARKYFRHSGVHCVLSPRYASNKLSIFKQQVWILFLPCCYIHVVKGVEPLTSRTAATQFVAVGRLLR